VSFVGVLRFIADWHHAVAQGLDLACNIIDPDGPEEQE
jgi:hypothetical protein